MADVLRNELINDPLGRGYAGMTNLQAAQDLNVKYRFRNLLTMTASEVFNLINKVEFDALSAADQALIWNVLGLGQLNPFGLEATIFTAVFPKGGGTLTALSNARKQSLSRADELGLPDVKVGHVEAARV